MAELEGTCTRGFERVRDAFEACFAKHAEVGAAVSVYLEGEPVVDLWGGYADRDQRTPWQQDTLTLAFSATKGMTAACVHRLVEQGKLDLDAPVASYWPEFAAAGKSEIPLRWILTHRAGLADVQGTLTLEEVLAWDPVCAAIAAQPPHWEPGTRHGYHARSYGWILCGHVGVGGVTAQRGPALRHHAPDQLGGDGEQMLELPRFELTHVRPA